MEEDKEKESSEIAETSDEHSAPQESNKQEQEENTEPVDHDQETNSNQQNVNISCDPNAAGVQPHGAHSGSIYDWCKQFDPSSGYFYYYNYRTGATQWEMPEGFIETPQTAAYGYGAYGYPQYAATSSYDNSMTAVASFNAKTGSFNVAGTESHFSKMGRAMDRETRQMSAFFDMSTLDANREEAKRKKKMLQEAKGIDWRKYKEEKKKKRQKISHKWLYEDD